MTIINGPEDQKNVSPSSPPTYAEVAATRPQQAPSHTINGDAAIPPLPAQLPLQPTYHQPHEAMPGPPQRVYGPTPLAASQSTTMPVLPYYDPRSPWAMEAAASRAKRRFFGALFWGFLIWLAIWSLVGGFVDDAGRHQGGSWAVE